MTEEKKEKPMTFAELWKLDKEFGDSDFKYIAETIYDNGKKLKWPQELCEIVVDLCAKLDSLDNYYTEIFAAKDDDLQPLQRKLENHKHLPDGQAVEPL